MLIAYVAGPYRARTRWGVWRNICRAEDVGKELCKIGIYTIIPHKNTAWFDGLQPDCFWIEGGIRVMLQCDLLVMCPRWKDSEGACLEYESWNRMIHRRKLCFEWPKDKDKIKSLVER